MSIKLIIALSVILLSVTLMYCDDYNSDAPHPALGKVIRMRCTRRFSPGVCVEEVAPVWTFVFMAQNCTERLGCPNSFRTNRFPSYRACMRRCRVLVDAYLKLVEVEERSNSSMKNETIEEDAADKNDTSAEETDDGNLREGFGIIVTSRFHEKENTVNLEDLTQDLEEEVYKEPEPDMRFIVYKESNFNEDIHPPDVDYVSGEIRSEFDMLHA